MARPQTTSLKTLLGIAFMALLLIGSGCGGSSDGSYRPDPGPTNAPAPEPTPEPEPEPEPTDSPDECDNTNVYESTWEGIYDQIIVPQQCASPVCHGSNASGSLELGPEVAWENIHEVPAQGFALDLIEPGVPEESYFYLKLKAKTDPGSVEIAGSAMPTGPDALSDEQLELIRMWIKAGGSDEGTVPGTAELLDACLPEVRPISIRPLDAPDPDEGVQLVMPSWPLPAATEREICFAAYYDFCADIPDDYLSEDGLRFRIDEYNLRQDPQSHHLIMFEYEGSGDVDSPEFGAWTCSIGSNTGEACDPKDPDTCGDGFCISQIVDTPACIGYGPSGGPFALTSNSLLTVQQTSERREMPDGIYDEIPCKGIFYWNSHAFNLTGEDLAMAGRLNWRFAQNAETLSLPIFDADEILDISIPPFEEKTFCQTWVAPQYSRIYNMLSHYHERGREFLVYDPDGELIYQNFSYNDPLNKYFDPPLEMDSDSRDDRTFSYCATYNNGLGEDGEPDPSIVKRYSESPQNGLFGFSCTPTHCWSGEIGKRCNGTDDHATCDSSPGAGDGLCDACTVNGGVTTEDEMFLILGAYYMEDPDQ